MVKWTDDVYALDLELRVLPMFIHSSFSHFLRPKPMWQLSQNFIRSKISNCLTYLVRPRPVSSSQLPSIYQAVDFFLLNCSATLLFLITSSKYLTKIIFRMKDLFHREGAWHTRCPRWCLELVAWHVHFSRSGKRDSEWKQRWALTRKLCPCGPISDRPLV